MNKVCFMSLIVNLTLSPCALSGVCEDSANDVRDSYSLQQCEKKVRINGTPHEYYLLAVSKRGHFDYFHGQKGLALLNGHEDLQYRKDQATLHEEVERLLEKSANMGNLDAQLSLGRFYSDISYSTLAFYNQHLRQFYDLKKAFHWYEQASKRGHADAQYELAGFYEKGDVVPADAEKALRLLAQSARQEHSGAASSLSRWFLAPGEEITDTVAYAWMLYHKQLESTKPYRMTTDESIDMMYKAFRSIAGRKQPLTMDQIQLANHFLDEIRNGRFSDKGIPDSLDALEKSWEEYGARSQK